MATGGADSASCSVCLDTFKTPRMLPCGHSFCTGCLKNVIKAGNLTCPDCREPFPDKGINEFPINYGLMSVIGAPPDLRESNNCSAHKLPKDFYCRGTNCSIAVCSKCWSSSHSKPPHCVVPIEEELETVSNGILSYENSDQYLVDQLNRANTTAISALQQAATISDRLRSMGIGNQEATKQSNVTLSTNEKEAVSKNALSKSPDASSTSSCSKAVPEKKKQKSVKEIVSKKTEEMRKSLYVERAAVDSTTQQIFMLDSSNRKIFVFDFKLCSTLTLAFEAGDIVDLAFSGNGTFYISYANDKEEQFVTSAVNKKTGVILRKIHSTNNSVGLLKAFNDKVFIVCIDETHNKQLLILNNEKLTRYINLDKDIYGIHFANSNLILYRKTVKRQEFVIKKMDFQKESEKVVEFDIGETSFASVWVPKSSDVGTSSGYLVVSPYLKSSELKVYGIDLQTVKDGAKLECVKFAIKSNDEYEQIYFYSAIGDKSVLCRMRSKKGVEKIAILKLEYD